MLGELLLYHAVGRTALDEHLVGHAQFLGDGQHKVVVAIALVDVHHNAILAKLQCLPQGGYLHAGNGDAVTALQVEPQQFVVGVVADFLAPRRASVECLVVAQHQDAVLGELQVELHDVDAHADDRLDGRQRIFGIVAPIAAMGHHDDIVGRWVVQGTDHLLRLVRQRLRHHEVVAAGCIFLAEDVGGDAFGQFDMQLSPVAAYDNLALRCVLHHVDPFQALRHLWADRHMTVAWFVGDDAPESLIEPRADAVIAVVQQTALTVPVLPCTGSAVVEHIEVARIVVLLQHGVHPVGLMMECGPFRQHGYAYQSRDQMALVELLCPCLERLDDTSAFRLRRHTDEHRVHHVYLAPCAIGGALGMIERLLYHPGQFGVTTLKLLCVGLLAQDTGYLFQLEVDLAQGAVVHQVDRLLVLHVHIGSLWGCPVA